MTAYSRGAKRELDVLRLYTQKGWLAVRTAGSHGVMDVLAVRGDQAPRLIQVKSDRAGPFAHFGPRDRRELIRAAENCGGVALLCWWPPDRKGPRFLEPADWPDN